MKPAGAEPRAGSARLSSEPGASAADGERAGFQGGDLVVYVCVACLLLLGWAGPAAWQARDPRMEVWAAWHEARRAPLDPWGNPFREDEAGIRSAGANGRFEEPGEASDDVWVPRVPPSELGVFRLLGWLPWLAAIGLAFAWEGLRWLRRPSQGLAGELPLALVGGATSGVALWGALTLLATRERAVNELAERVAGGLFVPPAVALGGSAGLCAFVLLLALRLRSAPEPESEEARPGAASPGGAP